MFFNYYYIDRENPLVLMNVIEKKLKKSTKKSLYFMVLFIIVQHKGIL